MFQGARSGNSKHSLLHQNATPHPLQVSTAVPEQDLFCPRPRRFAMIRLGCVKGRSRFKPRRPEDDRESDDLKRILFVKIAAEDCAAVLQNTTATYHQRTSTKTSHESESHSKSRGPVAMTCLGIEKSRFCLQGVRGRQENLETLGSETRSLQPIESADLSNTLT
jgi:hypothetical protein